MNKNHVSDHLHSNHSFLTYPLLVTNRISFMNLAEAAKIKLGDWFLSPIHPITDNLEQWHLNIKSVPIAMDISQNIVNLPTDTKKIKPVLQFLEQHHTMIK